MWASRCVVLCGLCSVMWYYMGVALCVRRVVWYYVGVALCGIMWLLCCVVLCGRRVALWVLLSIVNIVCMAW